MSLLINPMILVATVCLLVAVAPRQLEAANVNGAHLLCSNQRLTVTKVSQLEQLLKSIQEDNSLECPENTQNVLKSLISLARNDANKHLCSQEKADEILAFYRDIDLEHLHKDLRKIYLAYGLQVSNVCRKSMVDQLTKVVQSKELLSEDDFNEINKWTDDKSPMAKLLSEPSDYEDLVIPKHMIKLMKARDKALGRDDNDEKVKMFMQTSTNGTFASIKSICRRKFKPVYDQLIAPIVTLSSVGFNYKGETVARDKQINRQVFQWYRIVFICETLNSVEVLEDPEDPEKGKIRVFTMDEARSLFGAEVVDSNKDEVDGHGDFQVADLGRAAVKLDDDDLLFDLNDKDLVRAIKKHKEPSDRLSSRLNLKLVHFVLSTLKNKVVKVIGRLASPFTRNRPAKKSDESKEVIKFFEEFKTQIEEKNERTQVKTKLDRYLWKPLGVAINLALVALFFLAVFAVIIGIIATIGHIVGVAVGPLAIAPVMSIPHVALPHIAIPNISLGAIAALGGSGR